MTEESSSNNNNNNFNNESESVPILEDNVYVDVLTKLQSLKDLPEKEEHHRDVLQDGTKYMVELVAIIEEHKNNTMCQNTAMSITVGLEAFIDVVNEINVQELFENDSAYAYEMFYTYIRLLNLSGMKNYLKRVEMEDFVKVLYETFFSPVIFIIELAVFYCKFTVIDLEEPRDNQELLLIMLNYVKDELEPDSSLEYSTMARSILAVLWTYADQTVVIPNLIKVGYPEAILKWLSVTDRPSDESLTLASDDSSQSVKESKSEARRPLISIILNISYHDDGINTLNALNAINVIKKVQSSTEDSEINILSCMILALLLTPEQIKNDRKHMNNALDQLLQSVSNASKSKDFEDFDDFKDTISHISGPLVVLVKLFNDDRALDYILQHAQVELDASSTVEFFANLLLKFNDSVSSEKDPLKQLTCTALVNILWSVSFQDHHQYRRQLKNNQDLMIFLEKLADSDEINDTAAASSAQYVPKYIENIQTAAKGILLNMSEKISTTNTGNQSVLSPSNFLAKRGSVINEIIPETQSSIVDNKPMIMISYSHDDKVLCYQLEEELKRNDQFEVWIDKDFCSTGDSWEHIARGIKQSQVVLCLITKNYTGKSVRREVIYAIDRLEKPLLPVFILKPDLPEWLDIRTCDLTYVRFADEKQLERPKIPKLIKTLQKLVSGSTKSSGTAPTHYEEVTPLVQTFKEEKISLNTCTITNLSQKPIQQWNKIDIKQWWQENGIILELYDLCQFTDGSELLSFAENLLIDEKTHYKTYAEAFQKLHDGKMLLLHQFNKFSNALRKLINEHDRGTLKEKPIQNTSTTKSQTCQIV